MEDVMCDPRLAFIASAASGDHNSSDTSSQTFINLLPSNHGFYGAMDLSSCRTSSDYRLSVYGEAQRHDQPGARSFTSSTSKRQRLLVQCRGVPRNTAGPRRGVARVSAINPGYSSDLGQEVDLHGRMDRDIADCCSKAASGISSGANT